MGLSSPWAPTTYATGTQGKSDGGRQMAFAATGRAKHQQIGATRQPFITGGERHHLSLGDHRHSGKVERGDEGQHLLGLTKIY